MRLKICVFVIIATAPTIENFSCLPDQKLEEKSEEIIAETGSDVVFSCTPGQFGIELGTKPYYHFPFVLPKNLQRDNYEQLINERSSEYLDNGDFLVKNVNYAYIGAYICYKSVSCENVLNDSLLHEERSSVLLVSKKTYLYVKDENRLSLINTKLLSADVLGVQGQQIIIPCKPTSPDVKVELWIGKSQNPETQTKIILDTPQDDGVVYQYDPQEGFTFITNQTSIKFYTCKFSRNNKQEILTSRLVVTKRLSPLKLSVWPITDDHAVGKQLMIQCGIETAQNVTIEWTMTPQKDSDVRIEIFEKIQPRNNIISSLYYISDLHEEDEGFYYCKANFKENNFVFRSIYFAISKPDKYFLNIIPNHDDNITDLWSNENGVSVQWRILVNGFPDPETHWFRNGVELRSSPTFLIEFTPPEASLKITNVSDDAFANYSIIAINSYTSKSLDYYFNMTTSPLIRLEIVDLSQDLIKCMVVAFPEPQISWFFEDDLGELTVIEDNLQKNGIQWSSYIRANSSWRGFLTCQANNSLGQAQVTREISGFDNDFEIVGSDNIVDFFDGSKRLDAKFYEDVNFTCIFSIQNVTDTVKWSQNNKPLNMRSVKITNENAIYINRSILTICNVSDQDTGIYSCILEKIDGKVDLRSVLLVVGNKKIAANITSNINKEAEVGLEENFKFDCNISGFPSPVIKWSKANVTIEPSEKFKIKNYNQTLIVKNISEADVGPYKCEAFNPVGGIAYKEAVLKLKRTSFSHYFWITIIVILLILLILTLIFTAVKIRNEKKLQKELKVLGLENFEKGDLEKLNPELGLEEQAEFLPYDIRFEIPVEKLKLGTKLGSGAFGVVFKGELEEVPVAVKTISKTADFACFKALVSELKIMIHIGKHVNIVNLLGACTKNIAKKELFVIVEYCPFGNLQDYLQRHKEELINQIIEQRYAEDLIAWCFQVALGMEYLASKKVFHGDLAARNILLSNHKVVKICDFGLARNMYYADIYKKTEQIPLPVKWMAIESITYKVFSTKSDVWSFGILLWEIFSFGKTPYPGMDVNEIFYEKLTKGYRMESPEYASDQIYQIMQDCWKFEPQDRPSFTELAARLSLLLEKSAKNYYNNLNNTDLTMVRQTYVNEIQDSATVQMLNTPDLQHFHKNEECDGYLPMTSNTKTASKESYHCDLDEYSETNPNKTSNKDDEEFEETARNSLSLTHFSNPSYCHKNSNVCKLKITRI